MNQWNGLNRILFVYKAIGATLALLSLVLGILAIQLSSRKPIVAIATENDVCLFQGRRLEVPLVEPNIKRFIERYIRLYYEWSTLEPETIAQNISPLVTMGFREKAMTFLMDRKNKDFVGKTIQQNVSGLIVTITKDSTIASFDLVLRVNSIPLIVPTQVSFELVKGGPSEWNPLGLYINGMTLHEDK